MKFSKPFRAVRKGEIYPVSFNKGDACPKEFERTAKAMDALERPKPKPKAEE